MLNKILRTLFPRSAQPIITTPTERVPIFHSIIPNIKVMLNERITPIILLSCAALYGSYRLLLSRKNKYTHKLNLYFICPFAEELIGRYISNKMKQEYGVMSPVPAQVDDAVIRVNSAISKKHGIVPIASIGYYMDKAPFIFLSQNKQLIISSGMLHRFQNTDELAFEIMHEVCHYMLDHQTYRLLMGHNKIDSILYRHIKTLSPISSRLVEIKCENRVLSNILFSREVDADIMCIPLLEEAGYDAKKGVEYLSNSHKESCKAKEYSAIVRYYNDRYSRIKMM